MVYRGNATDVVSCASLQLQPVRYYLWRQNSFIDLRNIRTLHRQLRASVQMFTTRFAERGVFRYDARYAAVPSTLTPTAPHGASTPLSPAADLAHQKQRAIDVIDIGSIGYAGASRCFQWGYMLNGRSKAACIEAASHLQITVKLTPRNGSGPSGRDGGVDVLGNQDLAIDAPYRA